GHECPPPTLGARTLVWHLGISPHEEEARRPGWLRRGGQCLLRQLVRPLRWVRPRDDSLAEEHPRRAKKYDLGRVAFYADINDILMRLCSTLAYPRVG